MLDSVELIPQPLLLLWASRAVWAGKTRFLAKLNFAIFSSTSDFTNIDCKL